MSTGILMACVAPALAASAWLVVPPWPETRVRHVVNGVAGRDVRWRSMGELVRQRSWPGPARRRRLATDRMRTVRALTALASELDAGQPPALALAQCADDPPLWPRALAAVKVDADIPEALRADARDRPVLVQLAACWQVSAESGAGLAASVASLAASARTAEDTRVALEAELAGPRSTARLLSLLPMVGIGFGVLLGANPAAWLIGSSVGRLCLASAVLLVAAGTWWTGRIATSVERLM